MSDDSDPSFAMGDEGHVINQQGQPCANSTCAAIIGEEGAYLHSNRENGKLALLCPSCSMLARLHDSLRLPLVAL